MRAGLPIITTSVFGVKEQVIADLNAIVYQSGDFSALKEAMENIITNNDLLDRFLPKGIFSNLLEPTRKCCKNMRIFSSSQLPQAENLI